MNRNSFLRWAGSKQKLIPKLSEYWNDDFSRYLEPFMGSAQLFFSIQPQTAILSDTNIYLVETFRQIQKNPYPVYKIFKNFKNTKNQYYQVRSQDPSKLGVNERAARFIFLNRLCFNGLYRTNTVGDFNVPYGKNNRFDPDEEMEALKKSSKVLQNATIIQGDFEAVLSFHVREGDFVYIDPPYAVANRRIFKQYGPNSFGLFDLQRLQNLLKVINDRGASFILSYAYCSEAIKIFSDWNNVKTFTQRNISGFVEYRRKAAELIVTNIN